MGHALAVANLGAFGAGPPVSGSLLWLRADKGITLSTGVSQWNDQSSSGNNATQATGSAQPTYNATDVAYNRCPTLSFAQASTQTLTLASRLPAQPFTLFVVGQSSSLATQQSFFSDSNIVTIYWTGTVWAIYAGASVNSANSTQNSPLAFCGVFNTNTSSLYINSSASPAASGNISLNNPAGTESIGGGSAAGYLNGKIAEIIVYSGAMSIANISSTFSYLGSRYGQAWS